MPRSAPLLLACLLAAQPFAGAGADPGHDNAKGPGLESAADVRAAPAPPSGRRVLRDLAYGPSPLQSIDLYLPPGATAAPLVVMVHGGAWRFGDKATSRVVDNKVARWLPRGIGLVSVNYRLLPEAGLTLQAGDVAAALAFVQRHAGEWGANPREILLMGHSAGGHLVALLGADPGRVTAAGGLPWRGTVVLDSAALDVEALMARRHYRLHDRAFGKDPAQWAALSPRAQVSPGATPMLLVCSTKRPDHPCDDARDMATTLAAQGTPVQLQPEARSHSELNAGLGQDSDYTRAVEAFMAGVSPAWRERLAPPATR